VSPLARPVAQAAACLCAGMAEPVAQSENVLIARRLQRRLDDELVDVVGFEPVEIPEEICPFDFPAAQTARSAG